MSTIYIILGIVGWAAVAVVLPAYVAIPYSRRRTDARGFEVQPADDVEG